MQMLRTRKLVGDRMNNPARRKARKTTAKPNGRRKLTRAQKLAGFGGKRAQSAAKASRGSGSKRKASKRAGSKRKPTKNPMLASVGLGNPERGKKATMAKKKASTRARTRKASSKRKTSKKRSYSTRAKNPVRVIVAAPRRKKRNPSRRRSTAGGSKLMQTLTMATAAAIGGVATRAGTQAVLGTRNAGLEGYAANGLAAMAMGWGAGKVFSKQVGQWVTVGGFVGIVLRLIGEYTEIGKRVNLQLSGMGDYQFAGISKGLGHFEPMDFFVPLASDAARGSVSAASKTPAVIGRTARALAPPPKVAGGGDSMAGLGAARSRYSGSRTWGVN